MRYYIIFGITIVLALLIMFYNPNSKKYLGIYKEDLTIEYNIIEDGYVWNYLSNSDIVSIEKISDTKWIVKPLKDGIVNVSFEFNNLETNERKYQIDYEFKIKNNKIYWTSGTGYGLLDYPNPY